MVWICIPVHNRVEYTLKCLYYLSIQTYKYFKVIVCDDGSTDGTSFQIAKEFPETILLKGNGNLWWAGAMNKCLEYVLDNGKSEDYVLMLNNDLKIEQNYLEILLQNISTEEVLGSVVADINNPSKVVFAGELLNNITAVSIKLHRKFDQINKNLKWETDILTGRGTLFPLQLLHSIGLMNAIKLPQYAADLEFSSRAAKSGYKLKICRDAIVYSYTEVTGIGSSFTKVSLKEFILSFFSLRSPNYYKARYYFAKEYSPVFPFFLFMNFLFTIGSFIKRKVVN